jgi:uncharacterized integral membrane protein
MIGWLVRIVVVVVLLTAAAFGALNSSIVELDVLFSTWRLPLGVALMLFFVMGATVGALVSYLALVPKLKREIARAKLPKTQP